MNGIEKVFLIPLLVMEVVTVIPVLTFTIQDEFYFVKLREIIFKFFFVGTLLCERKIIMWSFLQVFKCILFERSDNSFYFSLGTISIDYDFSFFHG